MKVKWSSLKEGDKFHTPIGIRIKVRDTGYFFGILNSQDLDGNRCWVDPDEEFEPVTEEQYLNHMYRETASE